MNYTVKPGGLMRCCLASLDEAMEAMEATTEYPEEGDTIKCKYCGNEMVFHAYWEWAKPKEK